MYAIRSYYDNVRQHLEMSDHDNNMKENSGLPIITFNDKLSIYINGEKVSVFHVDHAHTDGDAMLYFTESNILHTVITSYSIHYTKLYEKPLNIQLP